MARVRSDGEIRQKRCSRMALRFILATVRIRAPDRFLIPAP
jgi:hypothetical protein